MTPRPVDADPGINPDNRFYRALSAIERAGNRLPHPFWLFAILCILLGITSAIMSGLGVSVVLPADGSTAQVKNLFSIDGALFAIENALTNYATFPPLAMIVVVLLGVSIAERSGMLTALLRVTVGRLPRAWLTFSIAFASMIAHVMSDSAYLVMIPLGALAFRTAGRSPLLGLMVAYAATAVGFNASPLVTPSDAIRASLSMAASHIVDENYVVTPFATYFFTAASSVILSITIAVVVDKLLTRRPEFSPSRLDADFAVSDKLFNTDPTMQAGGSVTLRADERRGLIVSAVVFAIAAVGIALMLMPGSPFRGEGGSIVQ